MDQLMFDIFFWGVFVCGGSIFVIFAFIMTIKQYKRDIAKQKEDKANKEDMLIEPEYKQVESRATVVDLGCWVRTVGYKTPKTVREFAVMFQTEDGKELKLSIPEEMYHGLEKGQTGIVTIRNGELYSFELE